MFKVNHKELGREVFSSLSVIYDGILFSGRNSGRTAKKGFCHKENLKITKNIKCSTFLSKELCNVKCKVEGTQFLIL